VRMELRVAWIEHVELKVKEKFAEFGYF